MRSYQWGCRIGVEAVGKLLRTWKVILNEALPDRLSHCQLITATLRLT